MDCTNCGAKNGDGAKFCRACGTPLAAAAPPPPVPPQAPLPVPDPQTSPTAPLPVAQQVPPTAPLPVEQFTPPTPPPPGTPPPPPPPWAAPSPMPAAAAPAPPAHSNVVLIVSLCVVGAAVLVAIAFGGYFAAEQMGWLRSKTDATAETDSGSASEPGPTGSSTGAVVQGSQPPAPAGAPAQPPINPSGRVLDLENQPSDSQLAGLRHALLEAARSRFSTSSKFFVNQIWVDGDVAIGEIGAEHGGHRMWVVWRSGPWRVVWSDDWGSVDQQVLARQVGALPPELLSSIDWTKEWDSTKFKFIP